MGITKVQIILLAISLVSAIDLSCSADDACHSQINSHYVCRDSKCKHEGFSFLNFSNLIVAAIFVLGSGFANAGGLGGGVIVSPILTLLLGMDLKESVIITNLCIFSGSMMTNALLWTERTGSAETPFDFDIAVVLMPFLQAGSFTGIILSRFLPPAFILLCLVGFLLYSVNKVYQNIQKKKIEKDIVIKETSQLEMSLILPLSKSLTDTVHQDTSRNSHTFENPSILRNDHIKVFAICFLVILGASLLRGSPSSPSILAISSCSMVSWLILIGSQVYLIYLGLSKMNKISVNNDPSFSREQFILKCYIGGILAGTLGLGGGLITTPLLLHMDYPPQSAVAVSSLLLFFTTLSTTTQYVLAGKINLISSIPYISMALLGPIIGKKAINAYIKKTNNDQIVLYVLLGICILSAVTMPVFGSIRVFSAGGAFAFGRLC